MMNTGTVELFQGLKTCLYINVGALVFLTWDICITFADEVEQMWSRPWSLLKFLYYYLRYFSFSILLICLVVALKLDGGLIFSDRACFIWVGSQTISFQLLQMGVQIVLILRLHALYNENVTLKNLLSFLFCGEAIVVFVIFGLKFNQVTFGPQCAVLSVPVYTIVFFVLPILFETLLFALTMAKFYVALRDGWGREPAMTKFLKDGIWVFALPFVSSAVNACCVLLFRGPLSSVGFFWVIAVAGFAGYRLILNMSHLLRAATPTESHFTPDVTVPEMFDEETRYRHYRSTFFTRRAEANQGILTNDSEICPSDLRTL